MARVVPIRYTLKRLKATSVTSDRRFPPVQLRFMPRQRSEGALRTLWPWLAASLVKSGHVHADIPVNMAYTAPGISDNKTLDYGK
jgi:hypothetical protein